jgi:hypothetical protein
MKILGVTIGIGEKWEEAAKRNAERMEKNIGIECKVVSEDPFGLANPSWLKAYLHQMYPEYDRLIIFDADLISLQPWDAKRVCEEAEGMIAGVIDKGDGVVAECYNYNIDPATYINGGLVISGRIHQHIWERVKRGYPRYGTWAEQTALNKAIQKYTIGIYGLPQEYNHLFQYWKGKLDVDKVTDGKIINFHLSSLRGDAKALMEVQNILWKIIDKKK